MVPHLVRAQSTYKDIRIDSFHLKHTHTHTPRCVHAHTQTHAHPPTHTHTHPDACTHTPRHTHMRTHSHTTHTHTYTHHTCTHTNACACATHMHAHYKCMHCLEEMDGWIRNGVWMWMGVVFVCVSSSESKWMCLHDISPQRTVCACSCGGGGCIEFSSGGWGRWVCVGASALIKACVWLWLMSTLTGKICSSKKHKE